ncbi:MAG: NUDIX hydrolase family protein [Microbacteriaceae bacterium]|nr:NUDIX hydrolase family protein [Microbacteriaceae bacterium]
MSVRTPDADDNNWSDDSEWRSDENRAPLSDSGNSINPAWLSDTELIQIRQKLPLAYVEAVPVRLDGLGRVVEVGLLLRATPEGRITRTFVSGRVMHGETIRDALYRHLEKDLGPMAFPQLPISSVPQAVAEYFPSPSITQYTDDRQHAISLVYVVPVTGTCEPRQDALEVTWFSVSQAVSESVADELEGGRGSLLRIALGAIGALT